MGAKSTGLSLEKLSDVGQLYPVSPEAARDAALAICGHAAGCEDARMLMQACGLLPYESGENPAYLYGRKRSGR